MAAVARSGAAGRGDRRRRSGRGHTDAFDDADEQRAAAQAAIDELAGRGNLGAGTRNTR